MTTAAFPAHLRLAVLIPCRDEESAIGQVVADFRRALPQASIYVYDNNSADRTPEIARAAGAVVRSETRQGKGNVVRRMFADIEADIYVLCDGDATYDAAAAPAMIEALLEGPFDMVTGVRVGDGRDAYRRGHRAGNALLSRMVARIFGHRVADLLSGYRVLSRRFVKSFPTLASGFEIETAMTVHALELRMAIGEFRTAYTNRAPGSVSKLSTFKDGANILFAILMLIREEKPLPFYALIALLFGLVAGILMIPVVTVYLETGLVPRFPTAILSMGLVSIGFVSLACGLILDTVTRGRRETKRLHYLGIPATPAHRHRVNADRDPLPRARRQPALRIAAVILVPVAFGLLSVALGQDANWDLRNYHLYNAYAWLHQRMVIDLAPAQGASYLNPLIELPYYWLTRHASPWVAGFVMGVLHGLNFVVLLAIAQVLRATDDTSARAGSMPSFWLAAAGCTGAAFLSEIGNTMGDNLTSVFVLLAFLIVMRGMAADSGTSVRIEAPARRGENAGRAPDGFLTHMSLGGLIMGLGVGLKLANATFALGLLVAIPLALKTHPKSSDSPDKSGNTGNAVAGPPLRVRATLAYACAVAVGIAGTIGYWWALLWEIFGSPTFPFFNNVFRSPLALPVSATDARWFPSGFFEAIGWPFVFTIDPQRVSEIGLVQVLWPALYLLLIGCGLAMLVRRVRGRPVLAAPPAERLLLGFVVASFVAWMTVFGVYRYLVSVELLAPLALWLLCLRLFPPAWASSIGKACLGAIALVGVLGWTSWGHSRWSEQSFRVAAPAFAEPARTTIVKVGPEPMGWIVPFFPPALAFVSLATSFPESDAYVARTRATMSERGGPVYALVSVTASWRAQKVAHANEIMRGLGLSGLEPLCAAARWATERAHSRVTIQPPGPDSANVSCELVLAPGQAIDEAAQWRAAIDHATATLRRYGLRLERDACTVHEAFIGTAPIPFRLCPLSIIAREAASG